MKVIVFLFGIVYLFFYKFLRCFGIFGLGFFFFEVEEKGSWLGSIEMLKCRVWNIKFIIIVYFVLFKF